MIVAITKPDNSVEVCDDRIIEKGRIKPVITFHCIGKKSAEKLRRLINGVVVSVETK